MNSRITVVVTAFLAFTVWAICWKQGLLSGDFPWGTALVSLPRHSWWELWHSLCEERMGWPWEDSSQHQNRPSTGQSWAHQQCWCCFCDNMFRKGKTSCVTALTEEWENVTQPLTHQGQRGRGGGGAWGSGAEIPCSPWWDACGASLSWRTVSHGRTHTGVGEKCDTEEVAN